MKTYDEVVDYIYRIPKFTKKNTQVDTKLFYDFLGQPGMDQKIIHVSGTNGKGSVCAYINQIFMESGHAVGMFTSPHLVRVEERFQINGEQIKQNVFLELFQMISEKIKVYQKKNPSYYPTFFELLFFMAMLYFQKEKVEIIILETGLGGRLDATNIIANPMVCVITKMGLDHTEYLGDSIAEITAEKAGIIKKNVPLVYWSENDIVNAVILDKAKKKNASLYPIDMRNVIVEKNADKNIDFSYNSSYYKDMHCKLDNSALYQVENALLAIKVFEAIQEVLSVKKCNIRNGLRKTKWPGRMEEVEQNIYLDGAHNVDGIKAMLRGIQFTKGKKNILLFSAVKDKQYEEMIRELASRKEFGWIYITKIPGERGLDTEKIEQIFRTYTKAKIYVIKDIKEAYMKCLERMQKQEDIKAFYVVGSLYLIGLVKEVIEKHKLDLDSEELK